MSRNSELLEVNSRRQLIDLAADRGTVIHRTVLFLRVVAPAVGYAEGVEPANHMHGLRRFTVILMIQARNFYFRNAASNLCVKTVVTTGTLFQCLGTSAS